jgi:hypothetical protein
MIKQIGIPALPTFHPLYFKFILPEDAMIYQVLPKLSKSNRYSVDDVLTYVRGHFEVGEGNEDDCSCHTLCDFWGDSSKYKLFIKPELCAALELYQNSHDVDYEYIDDWPKDASTSGLNLVGSSELLAFIVGFFVYPVFPYVRYAVHYL